MNSLDAAGRVVGTKQSLKAIKEGRATKVVLAEDTEEPIRQQIMDACHACGVPIEAYESRQALGAACGIERSAAVVTLLK